MEEVGPTCDPSTSTPHAPRPTPPHFLGYWSGIGFVYFSLSDPHVGPVVGAHGISTSVRTLRPGQTVVVHQVPCLSPVRVCPTFTGFPYSRIRRVDPKSRWSWGQWTDPEPRPTVTRGVKGGARRERDVGVVSPSIGPTGCRPEVLPLSDRCPKTSGPGPSVSVS